MLVPPGCKVVDKSTFKVPQPPRNTGTLAGVVKVPPSTIYRYRRHMFDIDCKMNAKIECCIALSICSGLPCVPVLHVHLGGTELQAYDNIGMSAT